METLEAMLRARLSDPRASVGALDIRADRVLLHFGAVGPHRRITVRAEGNSLIVVSPELPALESSPAPAPTTEPAEPPQEEPDEEAADPRTRNQLMAEAAERGIEVSSRDTKATLRAKLAAAQPDQ